MERTPENRDNDPLGLELRYMRRDITDLKEDVRRFIDKVDRNYVTQEYLSSVRELQSKDIAEAKKTADRAFAMWIWIGMVVGGIVITAVVGSQFINRVP